MFTKIFNFAVVLLIGLAVQVHAQTMNDPELFEYVDCIPSKTFTNIMIDFDGKVAAKGNIYDGNSFVVVFPDNTFGLFVWLKISDHICVLDTGEFFPVALPV